MSDVLDDETAAAFGRRTAALLATSSPHLPTVLDVSVVAGRHELVLDEARGPSLKDVLEQRRRLQQGEAVTVIVSAARALASLHEAGYCGAAVTAADLRFDAVGTPMLVGLSALRETVHVGARGPADDWRGLADLADQLGLAAHGRAAGALGPAPLELGLALAALTAGETAQNLDRLEEALFTIAEPRAVQVDGARVPEQRTVTAPPPSRRRSAAHRRPSSSVLIEALDAGPAALLAEPLSRVRSRLSGLGARLHGRARLVIAASGAAIALTIITVAMLPHGDTSSAPSAGPATAGTRARATAAAAQPEYTTRATPRSDAISADDPVAAASSLLVRRDTCLELRDDERSACLAPVADGQPSALERPARPLGTLDPSLLERTGDSALIALTPKDPDTAPASALLMRTEAGWRLRELYEN